MSNAVMRWQLLAKDPDRLAGFYSGLFGWKVDADNPLGYREIAAEGKGIGGGIWPSPPEGHSFAQLFVEVDDVAATVDRARELGADVIVAPQRLPDGDQLAILRDLEGIPFGVFGR